MYEAGSGSNKMVETTDSLETVGVFKAAKNFFFVLLVLSLLVSQAIFWIVNLKMVKWAGETDVKEESAAVVEEPAQVEQVEPSKLVDTDLKVVQEKDKKAAKGLEKAAKEAVQVVAESTEQMEVVPDEAAPDQAEAAQAEKEKVKLDVKIDWVYLQNILKVINAIQVFAICAYMLILLFALKVSLAGRLGGMSHISTAFLVSLFAALFILPWQLAFPGLTLAGSLFTASELADWSGKVADGGVIFAIFYYIRFVLTFLVVLWLLIWAQLRSRKWSRATLKRLGIIQ